MQFHTPGWSVALLAFTELVEGFTTETEKGGGEKGKAYLLYPPRPGFPLGERRQTQMWVRTNVHKPEKHFHTQCEWWIVLVVTREETGDFTGQLDCPGCATAGTSRGTESRKGQHKDSAVALDSRRREGSSASEGCCGHDNVKEGNVFSKLHSWEGDFELWLPVNMALVA